MNFQNSLYSVESKVSAEDGCIYTIRMNADNVIYKAHFPEEPITPGVCILQTGLELMSDAVCRKLELRRVKNVKFLNVLRPDGSAVRVRVYKISETDDSVKAQVDVESNGLPIAKMSLTCR